VLAACQPTITSPTGAATCTISVKPQSGSPADTFTATVVSQNALACTYSVDGKGMMPIPCNGTLSATGAQGGGPGMHRITVVAGGAQGTGTCSAAWTVLGGAFDLGGGLPDLGTSPDLATAPDLAPPPTMLDLNQATIYDNPPDLASWPVTTMITDVEFQYNGQDGVHVEFSKRSDGTWPDVVPPGWMGPLEYTLGMAEFIDGQWYASAAIQFWRGLDQSGGNVALDNQVAKNWYYDGRWGKLAGRQPQPGELIGIFVAAGNLRGVTADDPNQSPVMERSNVVLVPFPGVNGAKYTF
jgi:hypothetical protein